MKQYNLNPKITKLSFGEINAIKLGEHGRARKRVFVPMASNAEGNYVKITLSKTGKPKIVKAKSDRNWLAYVSACGVYTRNTLGDAYVHKNQVDNVSVVEFGHGAYGTAGRVGDWYDYLLKIKDNTLIYVKPSGGSHKITSYYLYFGENQVRRIDVEDIDNFLDIYDIDLDANIESFVTFKMKNK